MAVIIIDSKLSDSEKKELDRRATRYAEGTSDAYAFVHGSRPNSYVPLANAEYVASWMMIKLGRNFAYHVKK